MSVQETVETWGYKGPSSSFFNDNRRMVDQRVEWDGHRSIRATDTEGLNIGFATATYSYHLDYDERAEVARRMAACWNLLRGQSTEAIEAALAQRNPSPPSNG